MCRQMSAQLLAFIVATISSSVTRRCILNWFNGEHRALVQLTMLSCAAKQMKNISNYRYEATLTVPTVTCASSRRIKLNLCVHRRTTLHFFITTSLKKSKSILWLFFMMCFCIPLLLLRLLFATLLQSPNDDMLKAIVMMKKQALTMPFVCVPVPCCVHYQHRNIGW